jgi:hypothetical protein
MNAMRDAFFSVAYGDRGPLRAAFNAMVDAIPSSGANQPHQQPMQHQQSTQQTTAVPARSQRKPPTPTTHKGQRQGSTAIKKQESAWALVNKEIPILVKRRNEAFKDLKTKFPFIKQKGDALPSKLEHHEKEKEIKASDYWQAYMFAHTRLARAKEEGRAEFLLKFPKGIENSKPVNGSKASLKRIKRKKAAEKRSKQTKKNVANTESDMETNVSVADGAKRKV